MNFSQATLDRFLDVLPKSLLAKRLDEISDFLPTYPEFIGPVVRRRYLEILLLSYVPSCPAKVRARFRKWAPNKRRLFDFIECFEWVRCRINSKKSRDRFERRLRDALFGQEQGLLPLEFELRILSSLRAKHFSVGLNDYENRRGFDFLAINGSECIEVECKLVADDTGTGLKLISAANWAKKTKDAYAQHCLTHDTLAIVHLDLSARREASDDDVSLVASLINQSLIAGSAVSRGGITINYVRGSDELLILLRTFESDHGKIRAIENERVQGFLRTSLENECKIPSRCFIAPTDVAPGHKLVVAISASSYGNRTRSIAETLIDEANRQFTGTRKAILNVMLSGASNDHIMAMAYGSNEQASPVDFIRLDDLKQRLSQRSGLQHFREIWLHSGIPVVDDSAIEVNAEALAWASVGVLNQSPESGLTLRAPFAPKIFPPTG